MSDAAAETGAMDAAPELIIGIAEATPQGQVTFRGDLSAVDLSVVDGLTVPGTLQTTAAGSSRAIWMSPDELLLLVKDAPATVTALTEQLAGQHAMALDVSDARIAFRLTGDLVGEVLAKGAPCDCSDHGFPPGTARRTHLGGLAVAIWRIDAGTWEIACFRSFAHHLKAWLEQAAVAGSEVGWSG
ncbi:MAG: sarcosine oxidase subunit gamma family protein [Pseudomonadota bacterium]